MALNCEGTGTCTSEGSFGLENTRVLNVYDELLVVEEFTSGVCSGDVRGRIKRTDAHRSLSFAKGSAGNIEAEFDINLGFEGKSSVKNWIPLRILIAIKFRLILWRN